MTVTVLLGGDVMLGRGVDQILPHPGSPELREPWVWDARRYVELAERAHGPVPRPCGYDWVWGELPGLLDELAPEVRLVNLETAITADGDFAPGKAIHYRMQPGNLPALTAFAPDVCALSNNHALDFGIGGLMDTLDVLAAADIRAVGAGADLAAAQQPAAVPLPGGRRMLIASVSTRSSGVPADWAAAAGRPGVRRIDHPSVRHADEIAAHLAAHRRAGEPTVVSVHWGSNWGYGTGLSERQFAHRLIDAGIDIVHGHSAHHPRPVEIYRGKPILYGCGDVIDDYEGIGGHESYRPELRLLYLATVDLSGPAVLRMLPLRIRRLRLERPGRSDTQWLRTRLADISYRFGTRVELGTDDLLTAEPAV
ncbi:CapA family protein [Nocardia grenadensis]|uniref:CapA family protein n=1 Tax=Nocardia grenadensis TaxID=931537 RepID=UPI0007A4C60F|nr:CapA family protein [Nocardia grenadensis]